MQLTYLTLVSSFLVLSSTKGENCDGVLNLGIFVDSFLRKSLVDEHGMKSFYQEFKPILNVVIKTVQSIFDDSSLEKQIKVKVTSMQTYTVAESSPQEVDASEYLDTFCTTLHKVKALFSGQSI